MNISYPPINFHNSFLARTPQFLLSLNKFTTFDPKLIADDIHKYIHSIEVDTSFNDCEKNNLTLAYFYEKTNQLQGSEKAAVLALLKGNFSLEYALKAEAISQKPEPYVEDINCDGALNFTEMETQSNSPQNIAQAVVEHATLHQDKVILLAEIHQYTLGKIPIEVMKQLRDQYSVEPLALGCELDPESFPHILTTIEQYKEAFKTTTEPLNMSQVIDDIYMAHLKDFTLSNLKDNPKDLEAFQTLDAKAQAAFLDAKAQKTKQALSIIFHPDVQANMMYELSQSIAYALSYGFDVFMFDSLLNEDSSKEHLREVGMGEKVLQKTQDHAAVVVIVGAEHAMKDRVDSPPEQKNLYAFLVDKDINVSSFFGAKHLDFRTQNDDIEIIKYRQFDGVFSSRDK